MDKAPTNQMSAVSHQAEEIGSLRLRDWRLASPTKSPISNLQSPFFFALNTSDTAHASANIVSGRAIMWACKSP